MTQLIEAAALPAARASVTDAAALSITIATDLATLRREWDAMIADGCASAYQAFAFQHAWATRQRRLTARAASQPSCAMPAGAL